jgi:hypothetical protein
MPTTANHLNGNACESGVYTPVFGASFPQWNRQEQPEQPNTGRGGFPQSVTSL